MTILASVLSTSLISRYDLLDDFGKGTNCFLGVIGSLISLWLVDNTSKLENKPVMLSLFS
jgi:hypothetical protein